MSACIAAWQQQQLSEGRWKEHREYWLRQMDGEIPVLQLPSDKVRPSMLTYDGYSLSVVIGTDRVAGLQRLCREAKSSLFMGLTSVWMTVFHAYTGQEDIIIGTPIAGREHEELQDQVGFYLNTLALRVRFSGEDSFIQLLENVRGVTLAAYEHQSFPFDRLVSELALKRETNRSPLFDVMIGSQNQQAASREQRETTAAIPELPGIVDEGKGLSKFDLSIDFSETAGGLRLRMNFNSDVFSPAFIERMIFHYINMLDSVVDHPGVAINRQEYVDVAEKNRLMKNFNSTGVGHSMDRTLVDLIEDQARLHPEYMAAIHEDANLSYAALSGRSNDLAVKLRSAGIGEGCFVPVIMSRGLDYVVAFLAVLKVGEE